MISKSVTTLILNTYIIKRVYKVSKHIKRLLISYSKCTVDESAITGSERAKEEESKPEKREEQERRARKRVNGTKVW